MEEKNKELLGETTTLPLKDELEKEQEEKAEEVLAEKNIAEAEALLSKEKDITKKSKKNKKILIPIIIGLVLLLVVGGVLGYNYCFKKDNNTNNKKTVKDKELYPPKDAEIKDSDKAFFTLHCIKSDTEEYANGEIVKAGDTLSCSYGFEFGNSIKASSAYFQLDYGEGLEYLGTSKITDNNIKVKGNRTKIDYDNPTNIVDVPGFEYNFKVKEGATLESLNIALTDIVIKTSKNEYYKLQDEVVNFKLKSSIYYIYKSDSGYLDISDTKIDKKDWKYLGEYKCENKDDCEGFNQYGDSNGTYVLFKDSSYVAYNYKTGEKVDLSKFDSYDEIELVADNKLIGIVVYGNEDDYGYGYYSIKNNKYIIPTNKDLVIFVEEGYIHVFDETDYSKSKLMDYYGKDFIPSKKQLTKYEKTNFYYIEEEVEIREGVDTVYYFFNKNGKKLFKGKPFSLYEFTSSSSDNILFEEKNSFAEYDVNENKVFESKKYSNVSILKEKKGIAVVGEDGSAKIVTDKEEVIVDFGTLLSGEEFFFADYYEEDNEYAIFVKSNALTKEEMKKIKDDLKESYDEDEIEDALDCCIETGYYYVYNVDKKSIEKYADYTFTNLF